MDNTEKPAVVILKTLGGSLALLLIASVLAAAIVIATLDFARTAQQANQQAVAQQAETGARLARVHDDEREIRAKIARYQEIIDAGRSAPERRLEWVETLKKIKDTRRLLGLDYEISPQRPLDAKSLGAGGFDFLTSPMKLEMPLLHENDLFGLFADLSAQVQALISIKHCRIDRVPPDPAKRNSATLKAHCEIDWITLRERT